MKSEKPETLLAIATTLAAGADILFEVFKDYNSFLLSHNITDIPPLNQWLGFYKDHRILLKKQKELFLQTIENDNALLNHFVLFSKELLPSYDSNLENTLEVIDELSKEEKDLISTKFGELDLRDSHKLGKAVTLPMEKDKINKIPEWTFMARVWFPCFFVYGEYPTNLYRKARQGDINSICKLLRIDKAITADNRIARHAQIASLNPKSDEYSKIKNATNGTLKITSMKKVKIRIAGFVASMARFLGFKLTTTEIQNLFDIIAKVRSYDLVDADLDQSPESFYMNIRRQLPTWNVMPKIVLKPNKK